MDDDSLMRLAADGDAAAFGIIVRAHQVRLVRFAMRLTGDSDLAQDAVQETFLRLWRVRATYQPRNRRRAFSRQVAAAGVGYTTSVLRLYSGRDNK